MYKYVYVCERIHIYIYIYMYQICQDVHNILTIIEHRFGHQSGLDESSGRFFSVFLHGIALRVYLMFSGNEHNHQI